MKQVCKTDKNRDLGFTIPDMAINVTEAIETGVVKHAVGNASQYNMIQDTDGIGSVVRDPFTAIDAQRTIQNQLNSTE